MNYYANKEWYYLEENNNELFFYKFCHPHLLKFDEKEVIMIGALNLVEKFKIDKIIINQKNQSLEIYSIVIGVTQKIIISKNDKHKININFSYFVNEEKEDNLNKFTRIATTKKGLNKVKVKEFCDSSKSKKVKSQESFEEPPLPPENK
ncbi:hypothetical protein E0I26_14930 [Flavobacterium rhamnosiphilum]|uniref:Uncharacterized protein n=1 Tax=Flavobacterium rhamnosiphilum TaxID=2541724 RepID=A0A4R5F335_9FLAO|nr:hypothetical protein [Flavobacterium rhamnosiphilum]TDE42009.1 hypothetical protein E0I26_14930 [Flavobacterium rhamnosiphilum]